MAKSEKVCCDKLSLANCQTDVHRDKTLVVAHVFFAAILGVFAGGLYYKVGLTIAGFQNRVGSLFFLGSLIAFSSLR